jgi:hypothetical protein
MDIYFWIVCCLAAVETLLVAGFFLFVRTAPYVDARSRFVMAAGLSGFVAHAFIFFEGAILYVHLAALAAIYFGVAVWPSKARPEADPFLEPEQPLP